MTMLRLFAFSILIGSALACGKGSEPSATPAPATPAERAPENVAPTPAAAEPSPSHTATKPPEAPQPPEGMVHVSSGSVDLAPPEEVRGGAPARPTQVGAFFLDRTEVTVGAYLACVEAGRCSAPSKEVTSPGKASDCNATKKKPKLDHPMNCVTKVQAEAFCTSQGKRLPTEAEWTFAARGPEGRFYPWGNELQVEQVCWQARKDAETKATCAVGSFPQGASVFGALDMAGNVAEWTSTAETERGLPGLFYTRGGGYKLDDPRMELAEPGGTKIRSQHHATSEQTDVLPDLGFRCARSI